MILFDSKVFYIDRIRTFGFTIIELMLALLVLGVLISVAIPVYQNYEERVDDNKAIQDILAIQLVTDDYILTNNTPPSSLVDIGLDSLKDPWGNPYEYLNYSTNPPGDRRKDKNLNPLNSYYDLYSKGVDGESNKQIITKKSQDDIIRGRDGAFIGHAKDF